MSKILSYQKITELVNDKKNLYKLFLALVIFLSLLKLPPLFTTDIQPWDEGMYATRVLSIEKFGDFLDQSSHSVGKYYSSTHPPLLIWLGYLASKVTGLNAVTLKLVTYVFAMLCLLFLIKLGGIISNQETGFLAAIIFASNIIFNIFSKRFQFDIPYTFFVILSFWFFVKYLDDRQKKFLLFSGIAAGLCLLSKLLVGLVIPIVLFGSYFFIRRESGFSFRDFMVISGLALLISLPWYIFLVVNSGRDAFDYIINFHLFQRATVGIEQNAKGSGIFYFFNYFLTIVPFGFIAFYALGKNLKNFYNISWKLKFISVWFVICFVIVSLFKTKLESYSFLFLPPACILTADFVSKLQLAHKKEKIILLVLLCLNVIWYSSENYRVNLKSFLSYSMLHKAELLLAAVLLLLILFFLFKKLSDKINIKTALMSIICLTFVFSNIYYLFNVPYWENGYKISSIKSIIDSDKQKPVMYVASNYRHNPQLTFYFNGADLGWGEKISGYNFSMLDTKSGTDSVKKNLESLAPNYFVIVEKDNINRAEYPDSKLFIPGNFKLLDKTSGYELYKNF